MQVFVPQDWSNVITSASKCLRVSKEHFDLFGQLNGTIGDSKKDKKKYNKDLETYYFQFKRIIDEKFSFSTCQCPFLGNGRPLAIFRRYFALYSIKILLIFHQKKWKNLQTLIEYIPPRYHKFYIDLKHGGKKIPKAGKSKVKLLKPLLQRQKIRGMMLN